MNFRTGDFGKYETFIRDTERRYGLPVNLLAVTLFQASKYDPAHISGKGRRSVGGNIALGIANLTGDDCKVLWEGVDKRLDPLASIVGCALLLRAHFARFGTWHHALLSYHSSPGIVRNALQDGLPMPIDASRYVNEARAHCHV